MARLTQSMTAQTRKNKISRLEKHVKRLTTTKDETKQVGGRLVVEPSTRYRGGQEALDKLKVLKSGL